MTNFLKDFDFELPESFIAKFPIEKRDSSKLLVYKKSKIIDSVFNKVDDFLDEKTVFVLNDTKVIKARLLFELNDKKVEIFFVNQVKDSEYVVLVKPGKLFKVGFRFELPGGIGAEIASVFEDGTRLLRVLDEDFNLVEYLNMYGLIPLPPYMGVENPNEYELRYQTVYAKNYGSVAAPTAGLHFTPELIERLKEKGFEFLFVTLNVGLGTFQPVRVDNISDHNMHSESFEMSEQTASRLNDLKNMGYKVVPVGTTSLRVLQSSYDFDLKQFIAKTGDTNIFIYPGFKDWVVDAIITNFHLPKSTLFMLVSAMIGRETAKGMYEHAKENQYRFYSFGDASLLFLD